MYKDDGLSVFRNISFPIILFSFKDVLLRQARHLAKTSYICLKDVLNVNVKVIFVRRFEDTFARYIIDVL